MARISPKKPRKTAKKRVKAEKPVPGTGAATQGFTFIQPSSQLDTIHSEPCFRHKIPIGLAPVKEELDVSFLEDIIRQSGIEEHLDADLFSE